MSTNAAKTHTHGSNRLKPKDTGQKVVFKSTLDSPFRVPWPTIPLSLQQLVLARLLTETSGMAEQHRLRKKETKKRKRTAADSGDDAKRRISTRLSAEALRHEEQPDAMELSTPYESEPKVPNAKVEAELVVPPIAQHLVVGINAVTKRLELQTREARKIVVVSNELEMGMENPSLQFVFVCRADVNPPMLVNHLPHLVAAYNSAPSTSPIKLAVLPQGAETQLAQSLGVRRAAVIAIDASFSGSTSFSELLEPVSTITAPWLSYSTQSPRYIPTHIKQLKTTAPKDMKARKEQRLEGKARAKERRKTKNRKVILKGSTANESAEGSSTLNKPT